MNHERREFVRNTTAFLAAAAGGLVVPLASRALEVESGTKPEIDADISAPEDLMREHGLLDRILLVYEEGLRRLRVKEDVPPEVFQKPATLIRKFVEDYHERQEENFIFTAFEQHKTLVDLVNVLRQQHDAGRKLTDVVLNAATAANFAKSDARQQLVHACEAFIHMYRPHAAREDTVLFPALYKVIGAKAVGELGEKFEAEEQRLFGAEGFDKNVDAVAAIEKQLGIYELAAFTPR